MKSKFRLVFLMCALLLGLSVTAAAQGQYRRRTVRTATVYQNDRRDSRRDEWRKWNKQRDRRDDRRDRYNDDRRGRYDNDRYDNDRYNNDRYRSGDRGRHNGSIYGNGNGARTYRLPNGRLVTILPNGRRIYH